MLALQLAREHVIRPAFHAGQGRIPRRRAELLVQDYRDVLELVALHLPGARIHKEAAADPTRKSDRD